MQKYLIVVDTYPSSSNVARLNKLIADGKALGQQVHIFFMDYGVFYLVAQDMERLAAENCLMYAHAHDAAKYNINYRDDVVFSGMPAFQQMLDTIPRVIYFKDEEIFPSPMLTQKK